MKTSLTKSLGLEEIDWKAILTKGLNNLLSHDEEIEYLNKMRDWSTCPCGHLSVHIPRKEDTYAPEDDILYTLGKVIFNQVDIINGFNSDYASALSILEMIKIREKYILSNLKEELEEKIAANTKQLLADKKILKAVSV